MSLGPIRETLGLAQYQKIQRYLEKLDPEYRDFAKSYLLYLLYGGEKAPATPWYITPLRSLGIRNAIIRLTITR